MEKRHLNFIRLRRKPRVYPGRKAQVGASARWNPSPVGGCHGVPGSASLRRGKAEGACPWGSIGAGMALWFFIASSSISELVADEVVLLEGKTVSGKIVSENEKSVTIQSGKSMVFTFDKSKVKKINRSENGSKRKGPTITLEDMNKKEAAEKKTSSSVPPPVKPVIFNPIEGKKYRNTSKDNVSLNETVVTRVYHVQGSTQSQIAEFIFDSEKGRGFPGGKERIASKTQFQASWSGIASKEGSQFRWDKVLIQSTATITLPFWDEPAKYEPTLAKQWEEMAKAIQQHADHEIKIFANSMVSLGESLITLRVPDEASLKKNSNLLFKEALERAEKQKLGFNRRRRVKK